MDKIAFIDVGELGWSLYLSAHVRWLKKNSDSMIAVISYPDRKCLYADMADDFIAVHKNFRKKYNIQYQDSFKLRYVGWNELRLFFSPCIPKDFRIPDLKEYPNRILHDKRIYAPYKYSKPPEPGREILVFPRFRPGVGRNMPEVFYSRLIERFCDEFPKMTVRTIGTRDGSYNMEIDKSNYINWVDGGESLQDMIDRCQSAVVAVGSQSALPKITLLQGVPTFIIGHQKGRHTQKENWMNTKVGFYEIGKKEYGKFDIDDCIQAAVAFAKGIQ